MLGILQKGASFSHYMYLRNCSLFRTIAGGEQLLRGTSHNEAEHRTLKRWTECIYAQHRDRLEFVRVVHALYRLLTNAYKTLNADGNAKLDERRCAHLLAGLVASGCLDEKPLENKAGCAKRPAAISAKPARATPRAALYTPLVGIDHAWLQVRASARASRREANCEE